MMNVTTSKQRTKADDNLYRGQRISPGWTENYTARFNFEDQENSNF